MPDGEKLPTLTGMKKYFAYCEFSDIFSGQTHFKPVMAVGLVSFA